MNIKGTLCKVSSFISLCEVMVKIKVGKIKKDSLDSIPSPSTSVKIQIIDGKVYMR